MTDDLTMDYGDVRALEGLNLSIPKGQMFGLLGPNGAGKTTAISILCGLRKQTRGRAVVGGYDLQTDAEKVKEMIGICTQSTSVFPYLTGKENVELFGELYGMPKAELRERTKDILERMGLTEDAGRRAGTYSEGMKRRLSLAMALVHDPEIVFLDEPTAAMDPQARRAVWGFIKEMKKEEKTAILTTHYIEEAEQLCDVVGVIDHGRLIALGSPRDLIDKYGAANLEEVFIQLTGRRIREEI